MIKLLRGNLNSVGCSGFRPIRRAYSNGGPPFQDDLTELDDDLFGLSDFKHYKEAPDVIAKRQELLGTVIEQQQNPAADKKQEKQKKQKNQEKSNLTKLTFEDAVLTKEPMVFISKVSDPYLNLAIEDYIYNKMPLPTNNQNYNRLMFYINQPCVVIGKNQNPWKEVNLPLLKSLHIPMLRRRSGGGTVVHDSGNENFSFMTTKEDFSRSKFVNLIVNAINDWGKCKYELEVNDRGDITTITQPDGINYKISGSAYKLSRGKSYHHGTMLLNLRLDILGKLLHTEPDKNGTVTETRSISSVRSKVANIEIGSKEFEQLVTNAFKQEYGMKVEVTEEEREHNSMLGLDDFFELKESQVFIINKETEFNEDILNTVEELKQWNWKFGNTPKFSHVFVNEEYGLTVKFIIDRHAIVENFEISIDANKLSEKEINDSFEFLRYIISQNKDKPDDEKLRYKGSDIAGFITNDAISDWIGSCIDGTN